jgi:stage II sporulation protein D
MRQTIVSIAMVTVTAVAASAATAAATPATPGTPGGVPTTLPAGTQALPATQAALSAPVFVLTGGGYGHGVGLSQYGALAQAKANRGYRDILSFYYPGTTIGTAPLQKLRVLVADARPAVKIASTVDFSVTDATGATTPLPAGEIALKPDLKVAVDGKPTPLPGPLTFQPGRGSVLTLDGKGFRGTLRVTAVQKKLQVVDVVSLDAYLLGVVPGEMPKEWPAAALQAQAVAARSYALASLVKNRDFDLYADPRSQMYYGVAAETPATTAAVQSTAGEVLMYDGKVAIGFYSSSDGGRTAASEDVFGLELPYLQTRDDPWDSLSPFHRWPPRSFTGAALAKALGLSAPVVDVDVVPTPSGRPASVTVVKKTGQSVLLKAADVRARLGLRSTAFRIGVLQVAAPPAAAVAGKPVQLSGLARDVEGALLEKLGANGSWLPSVRVSPGSDGAFSVTVRPTVTATYRLTAEGQAGPAVTITVPPAARRAK